MTQRHLLARAQRRGFTIIELLVAMSVASVVVASAFAIFATTSEGMYEVNSMTMSTDRARFAMELLSRDFQTAGAFGSIDTQNDEWVDQRQAQNYRLRAIYMLGSAGSGQDVQLGPQALANNADMRISSDAIILVGAYDLPLTFELSGMQGGAQFITDATIPINRRGAYRFVNVDAFDVRETGFVASDVSEGVRRRLFSGLGDNPRLLRVLDRNGFAQFATVGPMTWDATVGFELPIGSGASPSQVGLRYRQGNERAGIEPSSEEDAGYDATFLDVIRYRVCVDPLDERNLNLVRERLNPDLLMAVNVTEATIPTPAECGDGVSNNGVTGAILEQNIITNYVVDFQVWFDCADPGNNDQLSGVTFSSDWVTPDAIGPLPEANCLATENAMSNPFLARVAHARLSLRSEDERVDMTNYGFLTPAGTTDDATDAAVVGTLQTVDIDGNNETAARVVTMQTDVELPNFILRAGTRRRLTGR